MLKSVKGIYKQGKVELLETPDEPAEEAPVLVTFMEPTGRVILRERELDLEHSADLRNRLKAFATDWDRPEMDVYDAL